MFLPYNRFSVSTLFRTGAYNIKTASVIFGQVNRVYGQYCLWNFLGITFSTVLHASDPTSANNRNVIGSYNYTRTLSVYRCTHCAAGIEGGGTITLAFFLSSSSFYFFFLGVFFFFLFFSFHLCTAVLQLPTRLYHSQQSTLRKPIFQFESVVRVIPPVSAP